MPAISSIFKWLREHPEFSEQYARAKQEAADAMADEILDIADDGRNDWMTVRFGQNEVEMPNKEVLARSKLRVEARMWIASKLKPRKYGDNLKVAEPIEGGPLQRVKPNAIRFVNFKKPSEQNE